MKKLNKSNSIEQEKKKNTLPKRVHAFYFYKLSSKLKAATSENVDIWSEKNKNNMNKNKKKLHET